tara:strand:- start:1925 stop:2164 length:240 start_codon:yes stop_codon:yes gene_type:complete
MYDRMKKFLLRCVDLLIAVVLVGALLAYVVINSVLMTSVVNDLLLDTYVTYDTGFGIVMLILLLGWGPVWLSRSLRDRR